MQVRSGEQILEQVEGPRVQPLQIVEKERERVVRLSEDADEPSKRELETALCLLGRQLRDRWLVSDNKLQFGHQVDHQSSIRLQCVQKGFTPAIQFSVSPAQQRADQALKSLR
ncbi:MAG TPA: hypothetical protein VE621_01825 [Bryobacteraceae bacterium]|nr:hypothetical protein [Bryobacteraceae bacterium]